MDAPICFDKNIVALPRNAESVAILQSGNAHFAKAVQLEMDPAFKLGHPAALELYLAENARAVQLGMDLRG